MAGSDIYVYKKMRRENGDAVYALLHVITYGSGSATCACCQFPCDMWYWVKFEDSSQMKMCVRCIQTDQYM